MTSCESTSFVFLAATLLALTPSVGSAQERRFHVNFGGGPTFNAGDLGDHFENGWGPAIGITIDSPNDRVGFQFEYAYRWFDIKDDAPFAGRRDSPPTTRPTSWTSTSSRT